MEETTREMKETTRETKETTRETKETTRETKETTRETRETILENSGDNTGELRRQYWRTQETNEMVKERSRSEGSQVAGPSRIVGEGSIQELGEPTAPAIIGEHPLQQTFHTNPLPRVPFDWNALATHDTGGRGGVTQQAN